MAFTQALQNLNLSANQDLKWVKETLSGKKDSFNNLIKIHQKRIQCIGMSFFHNKTDSEDFVQEVFIKAFTNLDKFRGDSKFSTWLTRIAYTTAINSKTRTKTYETLADDTELLDRDLTPEEEQIRHVTCLAVKEAVKDLPENYSVCLDMFFFYDFSYDEISVITGLPVNTIKSNIFRAKKILRDKLMELV